MEASPPIRVILIDDHLWVHEAVSALMTAVCDVRLVGQGSNGVEALELCEALKPDLILMDVVMPSMNGVEATRHIHQRYPGIKILVLSSFQDDDSVRAMLANGAVGYVLKGSLSNDLISAIRGVHYGQAVFSTQVVDLLLEAARVEPLVQDFGLTAREMEVLRLLAEGLSYGEIGARLVISASTVKFHFANILNKMNVETRAEAIVLAVKTNLI